MHKFRSHLFKQTIIFKILKDMHLLMFPLLEEILRKHCMYSLKNKSQSTLKKLWHIWKTLLQNSNLLLIFKRKLSFLLNHNKILKDNTTQVRVASKANTWIKSNQSWLFIVVRKRLNLNFAKKRPIPYQYFHFLMPWPIKEKWIIILKSLKLSNR